MLEKLLYQLVDLKGMYYIRCARKAVVRLYDSQEEFEIGKGKELREGIRMMTIIAEWNYDGRVLEGSRCFSRKRYFCQSVDMFTIKPLDKELVLKCAEETGAVVTAENHSVYNGLGSAVCEVLAENLPVPVERIGIEDEFGEVGDMEYLKKRFHLTAEDIVKKAEKAIERKSKK